MEYKNDGEGTEAEIEKLEEQIPPNMKLKKKVEEVAAKLNIQSGTILCNCFTCGQPVCAPMSCSDLSNQGSTLDAKTVTAYKQKVSNDNSDGTDVHISLSVISSVPPYFPSPASLSVLTVSQNYFFVLSQVQSTKIHISLIDVINFTV